MIYLIEKIYRLNILLLNQVFNLVFHFLRYKFFLYRISNFFDTKKGRLVTGLFVLHSTSLLEIKHTLKHQPLHSQSCTVL